MTGASPQLVGEASASRRWAILGAGTLAQAAHATMVNGPAFLIPTLRREYGLSLAESGLVVAAPSLGVMLTLVAWGVVVDARGERFSLLAGLAGAVVAGAGAAVTAHRGVAVWVVALLLLVAGASAASTNGASGRVVVGWFPARRRGLAMGIRQTAQPLGVGVGAVGITVLADDGVGAALWLPTLMCLSALLLVAVVVVDPPRPERPAGRRERRAANPYRESSYLARIHGTAVLLVVPQFLVWTFALVWLVDERGWSPAAAGGLVGASQVLAALGRVAAGALSDAVGSRLAPLRWVAAAAAATMLTLGVTAALDLDAAVVVLVAATVVTVADNGLAFTAVAEGAGPFWSGRALGVHNTAQYLTASAVPPAAGLAIAATGFGATFAAAGLVALLALPLVPRRSEADLL